MSQTRLTEQEWLNQGRALFGDDFMKWRFVCPACGNVAAVEDFRPFKDKGADANTATNTCIGRFTGGEWLGVDGKKPTKPCNYVGYGLFRLSPVTVVTLEGQEIHSFAFADAIISQGAATPEQHKTPEIPNV